jgi:maltodextrin utilization protein YvdJ
MTVAMPYQLDFLGQTNYDELSEPTAKVVNPFAGSKKEIVNRQENPMLVMAEKGYEQAKTKAPFCSIEDSIVLHLSKKFENIFVDEGAMITDESRSWIRVTVRDIMTRLVAEL